MMIGGVPKFGHIGDFVRDTHRCLPVRHSFIRSLQTFI